MKQIQGKIYIIGAGFAGKMICREIKEWRNSYLADLSWKFFFRQV